jgi:hypothetical protein
MAIIGIEGAELTAMLGIGVMEPWFNVGTMGSVAACTSGAGGGLVRSLSLLGTCIDELPEDTGTCFLDIGSGFSVSVVVGLRYAFWSGAAVGATSFWIGETFIFSSTSLGFQSF